MIYSDKRDVLGGRPRSSFNLNQASIKECSVDLVIAYRTSALRATIRHMLDHFVCNLSKMGDSSYMMAEFYESSKNGFKKRVQE